MGLLSVGKQGQQGVAQERGSGRNGERQLSDEAWGKRKLDVTWLFCSFLIRLLSLVFGLSLCFDL